MDPSIPTQPTHTAPVETWLPPRASDLVVAGKLGALTLESAGEITKRPRIESVDTGSPLKWETTEDGLNYLPGNRIITELPTYCFGTRQTEGGKQRDRLNILPTAFDLLDAGEYRISDGNENYSFTVLRNEKGTFFTLRTIQSEVSLEAQHASASAKDKTLAQAQFVSANEAASYLEDAHSYFEQLTTTDRQHYLPLMVLKDFGYPEVEIDGISTLMAPTPLTLASMSEEKNIRVELVDETLDGGLKIYYNAVPPKRYGGAYRRARYAVGIRDIGYYGHDVEAAHFAAVVGCGNELLDRISGMSTAAIDSATNELTDLMFAISFGLDGLTVPRREGIKAHGAGDLTILFAKRMRVLVDAGKTTPLFEQGLAKLEALLADAPVSR